MPVSLPARFEVRRQLGAGGFGVVVEAFDVEARRRVAVKVLHSDAIETRAHLRREFRMLQDLAHPNLVTLGELGEHAGTLYFTMDLVDGMTFARWVRSEHGCDFDRLRDAFVQLVDGLAALHAAGLVHRDVKPENALVRTGDGRLQLLDFGLVAAASTAPTEDRVFGTPVYMAPEHLANVAVGPPADCYAAGVMLYEALAGRVPFTGSMVEIAMRKIAMSPPPLPAEVPADLAALCLALLAVEPADRPTAPAILASFGREPIRIVTLPPGDRRALATRSLLFGRSDELARLTAELASVRRGGARAVILRGESGIGKTTLARAFVETQLAHGLALWSRCYERETAPFKAVDGLIDGLTRAVAGTATARELAPDDATAVALMFPALGHAMGATGAPRGTSREIRARAFAAVRWLIDRLARSAPLVIVIDDLQWTDLDSLALLAHVLAPPEPPRVLLVGCVRDDVAAAAREAALRGLAVELHDIVLGPLDGASAALLAKHALGGGQVDGERIAREAAGHPLFTLALAHNLSQSRDAAPTLADVFTGRLSRLPEPAHRLATIACLAHAPITLAAAGEAAGIEPGALAVVVATLRVAQLVRTSGPSDHDLIEPFHDRVRVAVTAGLASGPLADLHATIARALEATRTGDPAALALHWAHAGDRDAAARYARVAADRSLDVLAYERATQLYRWVLELDPGAGDRGPLTARLGDALAGAGRVADAADAYLDAARAGGTDAVLLRRRAMYQLFLAGHIQRGLDLVDELARELDVANPGGPRAALVGLAVHRAKLALRPSPAPAGRASDRDLARIDFCFELGTGLALLDSVRALYFQTVNVWLSLRAGDSGRIARALMGEALYQATRGPSRRLERDLARCDELAAKHGDSARGWALCARGMASTALGRWRAAADCLEACERLIGNAPARVADEGVGYTWLLDSTRTMRGGPLLFLGRLRELRQFTTTNLRDALDRNDLVAATYLRTGTQTLFWLATSTVEAAIQHADEGLAPWAGNAGSLPALMDVQARVNIDLYRGDGAAALGRVQAAWPAFRRSLLLRVQYARVTLFDLRGRAAVAAARAAPASERRPLLAEAEHAAAGLAASSAAWAVPLADTIRAGAVAVRGGDATATVRRAIAGYEAADMRLHAELARLVLGGRDAREAYGWMAREAVVAPDRLAAVVAPGLLAAAP